MVEEWYHFAVCSGVRDHDPVKTGKDSCDLLLVALEKPAHLDDLLAIVVEAGPEYEGFLVPATPVQARCRLLTRGAYNERRQNEGVQP